MHGLGVTRNKKVAAARAARFARDRRIPAGVSAGGAPGKKYKDLVLAHFILGAGYDKVIAAAGERGWKILVLLIIGYPLGGNRRQCKSAATRVISKGFGVSPQQARSYKRDLARSLSDSRDPVVVALRCSDVLEWLFVNLDPANKEIKYTNALAFV